MIGARLVRLREDVARHWRLGARSRIPVCCRVRFIATAATMPDSLRNPESSVTGRLLRLLPRHVLGDGIVPCEYHALRWLLTGRPPVEPGDRVVEGETCCGVRAVLAEDGDAVLSRQTVAVEEVADGQPIPAGIASVWFLEVPGAEPLVVRRCPWCGTDLEAYAYGRPLARG